MNISAKLRGAIKLLWCIRLFVVLTTAEIYCTVLDVQRVQHEIHVTFDGDGRSATIVYCIIYNND